MLLFPLRNHLAEPKSIRAGQPSIFPLDSVGHKTVIGGLIWSNIERHLAAELHRYWTVVLAVVGFFCLPWETYICMYLSGAEVRQLSSENCKAKEGYLKVDTRLYDGWMSGYTIG